MNLNPNLRPLLKNSGFGDDIIITLFQIELDIGNFNLDHIMWLSSQNLIFRTQEGKIKLKIALLADQDDPVSSQPTITLDDIHAKVDIYRKLFKGVRTGSMGDKNTVIEYLYRFCLEEDKTMDEIIAVTQNYIDYTDTQYIVNADNFLYRYKDGREVSTLKIAFDEQSFDSNQKSYKLI